MDKETRGLTMAGMLPRGLDFIICKDSEKVYERQITRFIFKNEYSGKARLCDYVRNWR